MSIVAVLNNTIREKGIEAGVAQYRELKTKESATYDFAEGELNQLGYLLIRNGKVKEAIEIFKLNVEVYPQASNAYDSLGEAYMTAGKKDLAIKNYEKSVELNPENTNGVAMLKKLKAE